jgi:DNA-binding transcriptional regulator GbsR (MarR family)
MAHTSRREFLKKSTAVILANTVAASGIGYLACHTNRRSEINRLVDTFPTDLPGVGSIKDHNTPGATHCLVHIRQIHHSPLAHLIGDDPAQVEIMRAVQNDIYTTLSALIERKMIKRVYAEGDINDPLALRDTYERFAQSARSRKQRDQEIEDTLAALRTKQLSLAERKKRRKPNDAMENTIDEFESIMTDADIIMLEFKKEFSKPQNDFIEQYIATDATARLSLEKKIGIMPIEPAYTHDTLKRIEGEMAELAERKEKMTTGYRPLDTFRSIALHREYLHAIMTAREDAVIERLAVLADPFSYLVFGGAHDFSDTIRKWNSRHPENRFALLTITPASYR